MKVTYHLNQDDVIISVNKAWDYFADSNAAPELLSGTIEGTSLWNVIGDASVEKLYSQLFAAVRLNREDVTFDFRCDSPDVKRFMSMYVRPLPRSYLSIECSLIKEEQLPIPFHFVERQVQAPRSIKRCSVCNALNYNGEWTDVVDVCHRADVFDFKRPVSVAHVVCPSCTGMIHHKIEYISTAS